MHVVQNDYLSEFLQCSFLFLFVRVQNSLFGIRVITWKNLKVANHWTLRSRTDNHGYGPIFQSDSLCDRKSNSEPWSWFKEAEQNYKEIEIASQDRNLVITFIHNRKSTARQLNLELAATSALSQQMGHRRLNEKGILCQKSKTSRWCLKTLCKFFQISILLLNKMVSMKKDNNREELAMKVALKIGECFTKVWVLQRDMNTANIRKWICWDYMTGTIDEWLKNVQCLCR